MNIERLEQYQHSSNRALEWLLGRFQAEESYGNEAQDLACYYKSPYLFYISGNLEEACQILKTVRQKFMQDNGDFRTSQEVKSENPAFVEYWAYINGWIAIAAQKMGCFDVAYPAYEYLRGFYHPWNGGFTTNHPYSQEKRNVTDVLTTAHLGLAALYFGDLDRAKSAGNLLTRLIAIQPELEQRFYLRLDDENQLITDFPLAEGIFYQVSAIEPYQAYFMIGYPIAFLGKLYQATRNPDDLESAKAYLDFALGCDLNIQQFHFSHKVAWGAAIIGNLTGEVQYINFAQTIADYLLSIQDASGVWLKDEPPHTSFDQTAEIAIWLREISSELRI